MPTLEQVTQWAQEADEEFEKYYKNDFAGAMHPAIRIKIKQAYKKGYLKAMFKTSRESVN
jgi:hypothetical protein